MSEIDTDVGYFPPGSATRRVIGDPAALIGGFSALFLQALHPRAMAGVEQHSSFPDDFWPRLQRTAGYVTTVAFADTATADRAAARVRSIHAQVRGIDPVTGRGYSADDPDLLRWVHVSEVSSFVAAVRRLGLIDSATEDRFFAEQVRAGALLGATDLPASRAAVERYFTAVRPELVASPIAKRAARRLLLAPLPPRIALLTPARPAVDRRRSGGDRAAPRVGEGALRAAARAGHGVGHRRGHHRGPLDAAGRCACRQRSHWTASTATVIPAATAAAAVPRPSWCRSA